MSTGSGGKGAPNYAGLAQQQAAGQLDLLNAQTWANRPNVTTPWGSYTWSPPEGTTGPSYSASGGTGADASQVGSPGVAAGISGAMDSAAMGGGLWGNDTSANSVLDNPAAAAGIGSPQSDAAASGGGVGGQWSLDVALDPAEQAALEQQRALRSGANTAAMDRLNAGISGQGVEDALYARLTSRLDPQWTQRADQQRTNLYNMGLREGDSAFDQQMGNFNRDRNDAYSQAGYQSVLGGDQSASNQVNIINALRSGNSVSMPSQPGFSQAGLGQAPDIIGAANAQAAYNQQNSPLAMAGQIAPYAMMAYMLSDARLKTNIHYLEAEALPGVKWATWDWKAGGKGRGVIAQDLLSAGREDLVLLGEDGFFRVDYSRIGA